MDLVDDRLSAGSVIRALITDTTPPKDKHFTMVGITNDELALAAVYINSAINPNVFRQLRNGHTGLKKDSHEFLIHDSFIHCTSLKIKEESEVLNYIVTASKKFGYVGSLPQDVWQEKIVIF